MKTTHNLIYTEKRRKHSKNTQEKQGIAITGTTNWQVVTLLSTVVNHQF